MFPAPPAIEGPETTPVPRLLVELPSRRRVFVANLRDLILPERLPALDLKSAPAPFWHDVFVKRGYPWDGFLQSTAYHLIALGLLLGLSHLIALQPRVVPVQTFDHSAVVYYQPSEYLPPLDTRRDSPSRVAKADPEFSPQPVISVPPEADNHSQTIVTPPKIKLKQHVPLPNMVAWSDTLQKPRLAIPAAPLTPASEITRIAPKLDAPVVTPPPDAAKLNNRRNSVALQSSVVAPPPDVQIANASTVQGLQPALIAPPPSVQPTSDRPLGALDIGSSPVIAPAPQLPVAAERTAPGGLNGLQGQARVVPPPPSLTTGASGASFGSPGQVIALSLHPAVGAPPAPPAGNRRGAFAATPEGHAGASGSPGSSNGPSALGNGSRSGTKESGSLPSGLYVGAATAKPSTVAGPSGGASNSETVNPNLIASVRPPRITAKTMQAENNANLSEAERTVFGNRKFYSVMLNMPNFNSAGGSWVIRFAELNHESGPREASAPAADLTQPMVTRKVDPGYPIQLMRENVAGTVILYAVIHSDGTVGSVRVLRGVDDRLDHLAADAVAQWKFDPATKNGAPVEVEATFRIPFRPANVGSNF